MFEPNFVLEGGPIDVNGGMCINDRTMLAKPKSNPQFNQEQIEDYLKQYLNVSKVLWLKEGIAGDDADGHIDDIARFVAHDTIVCAYEDDPDDANYQPLQENYERLCEMTDAEGNPFKIIKLPMPGIVQVDKRLPASYCNFYIGNAAVVVPIFGHENDEKALSILRECFPDRNVVGIECTPLVVGLGTLHCSSQQQPSHLIFCELTILLFMNVLINHEYGRSLCFYQDRV